MSIKRVNPGDPIRATSWNQMADAVNGLRAPSTSVNAPPKGPGRENATRILVRNDSNADLPRFGALGIAGPIINPTGGVIHDVAFRNRVAVSGENITGGDLYKGRFVIAQQPILQDAIGWAAVAGVTPAIINVTDVAHTHADTAAGQQYPASGFAGSLRILWKEPGTGATQRAIVLFTYESAGGMYLAKVTTVYGATNADYDAEAIEDPSIAVSSLTPFNRLYALTDATFTPAQVGDFCRILTDGNNVRLEILTETIGGTHSCPSP